MATLIANVRPPPLALIVENHCDTREMYAEALALHGVRVVEAATFIEALELAQTLHPDVITTDLGLPGGADGVQLCQQLKGDVRTQAIPVVAVTAWAIGGYVERARAAGCASVLLKPCLPSTLLVEIQRVLKERRAVRSALKRRTAEADASDYLNWDGRVSKHTVSRRHVAVNSRTGGTFPSQVSCRIGRR